MGKHSGWEGQTLSVKRCLGGFDDGLLLWLWFSIIYHMFMFWTLDGVGMTLDEGL